MRIIQTDENENSNMPIAIGRATFYLHVFSIYI